MTEILSAKKGYTGLSLRVNVLHDVLFIIAREGNMKSQYFPHMDDTIFPVAESGQSDSGYLDNVLEFLVTASDRTLPEGRYTDSTVEFWIVILGQGKPRIKNPDA